MTDHLTFDRLCDLADGTNSADSHLEAREHLLECAKCARQLTAITSLATETSALPREVAPPPELWTTICAELAPRAQAPLAPAPKVASWGGSGGARHWRLAAAGLVIAIGSSALTMVALRGGDRGGDRARDLGASVQVAAVPASASSTLPAHLASAERSYERSAETLRRTLDERRTLLAPSTVETVERSLRIADSAIAEARTALERDPSDGVLAALFASNYERKIDLLRRATELAPRT